LGGGGNDAVKNTNTNEIQILFAGYQKPAKLGKILICSSGAFKMPTKNKFFYLLLFEGTFTSVFKDNKS
jgi:hypothetical protein